MTRVIHTGDTHIGYAQYHSPVRRQDFLDAFAAVIDDAIEGEVDAVIHAGDLFHDRRPELGDLMGTISVLRRLDDAEIPFLAVVGNHESTRGGQWLDLFERLGLATRLGDAPTVVGDTAFYGLDHVPVSRRDDLEYAFADHDADYAALVAHGLFEPFGYADWDTAEVLGESDVAFDALLLGDNHTPDTAEVDGTWVTYPGSTERASASEREGRGYNLVTFDADAAGGDARVEIRRRALDTRPFVFVPVELREVFRRDVDVGVGRVDAGVQHCDLRALPASVELVPRLGDVDLVEAVGDVGGLGARAAGLGFGNRELVVGMNLRDAVLGRQFLGVDNAGIDFEQERVRYPELVFDRETLGLLDVVDDGGLTLLGLGLEFVDDRRVRDQRHVDLLGLYDEFGRSVGTHARRGQQREDAGARRPLKELSPRHPSNRTVRYEVVITCHLYL